MLISHLDLLATAPGGVARLRELILTLAVQGRLVAQDPNDEPASELLKKIREEKDRLIAEGKIKRDKPLAEVAEEEKSIELPTGWAWTNLATVGIISPKNEVNDDTVASFVEMRSIPAAFSAVHATESRPWREIKSGFTQFAEGDVGVAKITPCFENGKSTVFENLSNGIGAGTTELHIVRPLGGIAPRYVLLFLKTPAFLFKGEAVMTGSAGQKRMPRAYFESTPFPFPPLAEQSRIVTRVEELMRLCDTLEAKGQLEAKQHAQLVSTLLGTLTECATPEELAENWQRIATHFDLLLDRPEAVDALEQTILQLAVRGLLVPQDPQDEPASELLKKIRAEKDRLIAEGKIKRDKPLPPFAESEKPFALPDGWEWCRLGNVALVGPTNGLSPRPVETPTDIKCLSLSATTQGLFRPECFKYVDISALQAKQFWLKRGDLLIQRGNSLDYVGIAALYDGPDDAYIYPDLMMRLQLSQFISDTYVHSAMVCVEGRDYFKRSATGTQGTMPKVNQATVAGAPLPLPPSAEQSRIVTRLAELRRLCADLRKSLTSARDRQSQLAQALVEQQSTATV